ncbi:MULTISPECIES: hypothetical protein [unclassified Rhodococcus (in: high G+C Gram-positive bacteria)]|uniref:hypothetical protein n=1 Tax=unclassified Rhodococcus (in: high G+C Gram-positive bacteria) TaxID=192944 RepID=UPI0015C640FC|nr:MULTISPECIES: hypothetical protein [unclassified Rhodococcus (in: high G+C Gram-positive bacteria)]
MSLRIPDRTPRGNDAAQIDLPKWLLSHVAGAILDGLDGISFGIFNLDDLADELRGTKTAASNANTNANTAISIVTTVQQQVTAFDVKTNRSIGETITPLGYPSFSRSQLVMLPNTSTGTGGSGDNSHSHTITLGREPGKAFTNTTIVTFVRITADDAIKLMYFYAKGAPTSLVARFYRMNAAGDLAELLGTSSDLSGNILSSYTTQLVTFPDEALARTGDHIAMALTVQGTVTVAGVEIFDPAPLPGFNPVKNGAVLATTSPGSTVSQSALDFTSGWVTYVEASRSIGQETIKRALQDLYDRADGLGLGSSYSTSGAGLGLGIKSNAAAWTTTNDGYAHVLHTTPLATTKTHGRITVGSVNSSASERFAGPVMRSNANRSSWGGLFFDNNEYSLVKGTGPNAFSKLLTLPVTPIAGDVLEWDLLDAHWLVRRNGAVVIDDNFPTIAYGPTNLYEGIYVSRSNFQSSGTIADWLANDVADVETPVAA